MKSFSIEPFKTVFFSHGIMSLRHIQVVACSTNSFLFISGQCSVVWRYHSLLNLYPLMDVWVVSSFELLQNRAAVNTWIQDIFGESRVMNILCKIRLCREKYAMNILCKHVFTSLKQMPRIEIHGSYSKYMFNFLRNCQTDFQRGCAILYTHQEHMQGLFSPHPHKHLF